MPIQSGFREGPTLFVDDYNGRIGVNTEPRYDFHVDGDIYATGALHGGTNIHAASGWTPTIDARSGAVGSAAPGANILQGCRIMIPKSGTLNDFCVFVGTASGNIDGAVYSLSSATGRTRLWSSGSTAAVGSQAWQNLGDPALTVTAGQLLDLAVVGDNGTVTFGRVNQGTVNVGNLPAGVDSASSLLFWASATSFPAPASLSGLTGATGFVPYLSVNVD